MFRRVAISLYGTLFSLVVPKPSQKPPKSAIFVQKNSTPPKKFGGAVILASITRQFDIL
jgi:hypothetical protein